MCANTHLGLCGNEPRLCSYEPICGCTTPPCRLSSHLFSCLFVVSGLGVGTCRLICVVCFFVSVVSVPLSFVFLFVSVRLRGWGSRPSPGSPSSVAFLFVSVCVGLGSALLSSVFFFVSVLVSGLGCLPSSLFCLLLSFLSVFLCVVVVLAWWCLCGRGRGQTAGSGRNDNNNHLFL